MASYLQRSLSAQVNGGSRCHLWQQPFSAVRASGGYPGNACDLQIWQMTLKNSRAPPLYYLKLSASFHSHLWIQNGVTVPKRSIWVKIGDFCHVTLKFDEWPWKTIAHVFYATSSFVHHLIAICELKKESQSGNAKFGSKSAIFCPMWP